MKLFLWKIIALFSVVLGSLGPQVAAGSPVLLPPAETTVVRTEPIPVITASQSTEVVVTQNAASECAEAGFQMGRFDLILWHACDMSLAIGKAATAEVAVATEQPQWPELSVTGGPKHNLSSDYAPWTATGKVSATIISGTATGLPENSSSTLIRQIETSVVVTIKSDSGSDKSQQNIVMRC